MAEQKTKQTNDSIEDFLNKIENDQKREDSFELVKLMTEVTREQPKLWGTSIIGFGKYHYKYDSGHEGDSCKVGFSPRKQNLTLYISMGFEKSADLLQKLGKHKVSGGACLYINKLADVDKTVLKKLIRQSYDHMSARYK